MLADYSFRKKYQGVIDHTGYAGGQFTAAKSSPPQDKQKVLARVVVRRDGRVSINNGFFKELGLNNNSPIEFQFDTMLCMVRFRLNAPEPILPINMSMGTFIIDRNDAVTLLHQSNLTIKSPRNDSKVEFVIVRCDKEGWWYAKAAGYRLGIPEPNGLKHAGEESRRLWRLPHSFLIDTPVSKTPPTPPTPPATRCIVNGRDINKK